MNFFDKYGEIKKSYFVGEQGQSVEKVSDPLNDKIKHLPEIHQIRIRQMSHLMKTTPLVVYLTASGTAGVHCDDEEWKGGNWNEACFFSDTFFGPSHGVICDIFEEKLIEVGKRLGKE